MKTPVLKTTLKNNKDIFLIVDRIGIIGQSLTDDFAKDFLVVFVSGTPPLKNNGNIIFVALTNKIPKVPDYIYTKMFIVDDGTKTTKETIPSFIKKAAELNCDLYFVSSIRDQDKVIGEKMLQEYPKTKLLLFGDLFDQKVLFDKNSTISKYIIFANSSGKILVEGNGLNLNYPISFKDTIKLIIKASYLYLPQNIILLFQPHPITDISLANTFRKIDPLLEVDYINKSKKNNLKLPKNGLFAISKYNLKNRLEDLDFQNRNQNKDLATDYKKIKQPKNRGMIKTFMTFMLACLFLLLLPLIFTLMYLGLASWQLDQAMEYVNKGDFKNALKKSQNAKSFYELSDKSNEMLSNQAKLINLKTQAKSIDEKINNGKRIGEISIYVIEGLNSLNNVYSDNVNTREEFISFIDSFKKANTSIQKVNLEREGLVNEKNGINSITSFTELISNTSEILPQVMGLNSEKKYLILFQNNNEIRSGGGTVNAFGVVKINNGKIEKFKFFPAYLIDKNNNNSDASIAIQKYLSEKKFLFKGSLDSPDTLKNTLTVLDLFKNYSDEKIDGVIYIDKNFIDEIISSSNRNTTNSSDSIFNPTQVQYLSNNKKNDYFTSLLNNINFSSSENNSFVTLKLIKSIGESISKKSIYINLTDDNIQNSSSVNYLTGNLIDNRKSQINLIRDYFGLSESNLASNVENTLISRSVSKKISIEQDGKLYSTVSISYKNNSVKNTKENKEYKNYLRIILPKEAVIQEISIGGRKQDIFFVSETSSSNDQLEVSREVLGDKIVYGFLVSIPPEALKTIKLNYSTPFIVSEKPSTAYSLIIYKQPGMVSYTFDLSFSLPKEYVIIPDKPVSLEIDRDMQLKYIISKINN
jgi:hypothetical protein